jgi:general secretion pathway protein M
MAASPSPAVSSLLERANRSLGSALGRLSPRERSAVTIAAWLLGLCLLWWLAVAPAVQTLRMAPSQHLVADSQLASLRTMAATAEAVRAQAPTQPLSRAASLRALEESMAALGETARLTMTGDQPTVTLNNTPPEALALWLARVRINARLTPAEAQLNGTADPVGWSGSLVLAGPSLSEGG